MTPFISVVIPVFNEEQNLDELIARCVSTCEMLRRPFEIVLVDDGSSDHSQEKILAATDRYPERIIGVFLNRNYGQHAAIMVSTSQVIVEDLGSENGTTINGTPIDGPCPLEDGDVVTFADLVFRVEITRATPGGR